MFCRNCGHELEDEAVEFCSFCGVAIAPESNTERSDENELQNTSRKPSASFQNCTNTTKKSRKKAAIGIGAIILILIMIVAGTQIAIPTTVSTPFLVVEENKLMCVDNPSDEGIVIDSDFSGFTEGNATYVAALSSLIRYSDDGRYAFYLSNYDPSTGYVLTQVDLQKAEENKDLVATKRITSRVEADTLRLVGDTIIFEEQNQTSNSEDEWNYSHTLCCYSISTGQVQKLADAPNEWVLEAYTISTDGKTIIFEDGDALCLYYTPTNQKQTIAIDSALSSCNADLSEIYYIKLGEEVYRAVIDNGEITNTECVFSLRADTNATSGYIYHANSSSIVYDYYDGVAGYTCVHRGEMSPCFDDVELFSLNTISSVRSNSMQLYSSLLNSGLFGIQCKYNEARDTAEWSILDDNLQFYNSSINNADYIVNATWDSDQNILYIVYSCFENDSETFQLYAYPMEHGTITSETLISDDCAERVFYDTNSQALFYYDDYEPRKGSGTLCAITNGKYQTALVQDAYAEIPYNHPDSVIWSGVQFDERTNYILCWADVDFDDLEDYKGTLYALDLNADNPVTHLGNQVSMTSWGIHDGDILFIGNFDEQNGGTLFRFDGETISRERENVMAVATNSSHYYYLDFDW